MTELLIICRPFVHTLYSFSLSETIRPIFFHPFLVSYVEIQIICFVVREMSRNYFRIKNLYWNASFLFGTLYWVRVELMLRYSGSERGKLRLRFWN